MSAVAARPNPMERTNLRDERRGHAGALILGVGTAVPELRWTQQDKTDHLAAIWGLSGNALDRWRRIVAGSGIEHRHTAMAAEDVAHLSTAQRMAHYERLAPPLAELAARRALVEAGVAAEQVTDVVIVSCTGFSAPGLDVSLIERLGLRATTRRTTIGFMGCFGAINGLRVANGLCAADPDAVTLLVCCELCSLHMRTDDGPQNLVASALFSDGAAAAVLSSARSKSVTRRSPRSPIGESGPSAVGRVGRSASLLLTEGRDWMTWRITDAGFAMSLTRDVPIALRRSIAGFVSDLDGDDETTMIIHPGGPGVLDAIDDALALHGGRGIECSRRILRDFGNMSSPTVLFVLDEALRSGHESPMMMLAFGPGLTIEGLRVDFAHPAGA